MTNMNRVVALAFICAAAVSCGRGDFAPKQKGSQEKQENIRDFYYNDFVPLKPIVETFVQSNEDPFRTRFELQHRLNPRSDLRAVKVNGETLTSGYHFDGNFLVMEGFLPVGSEVKVQYHPENLSYAISLGKIIFPGGVDLMSIRVSFNGKEVSLDRLRMSVNDEGRLVLDPKVIVLDIEDSFELIKNHGLAIDIYAVTIN